MPSSFSRLNNSPMFSQNASKVLLRLRNISNSLHYSTGKVEVNGVELYYEKVGHGKIPVLLLPGALGCGISDFSPQLKGLNRDKFTVVSWDPRGYGKSIPPRRDFPLDFFYRDADDAVKLMKALGLPSFSMLGWSDGGNTAAIIAAKFPQNVKKMVLWGANSYITKEELKWYEDLRDISSWSKRMKQPMIDVYGEEYFRQTWSDWVDACIKIFNECDGNIYKHELRRIKAPTLIIHGMLDHLVPYHQPQYLHQSIKGSRFDCWPEGKHNLHLRYAEKFNKQVEAFLVE